MGQRILNRILLVDDDAEIREIARVFLEKEGYRVEEAASGEEALLLFHDGIDLVILDIMMPGMSGYQVCRQLRRCSNVPILYLTAKSADEDVVTGISAGGDGYLVKPFSSTQLVTQVKALMRRFRVYGGKQDANAETIVEWKGLCLDCSRNDVTREGKPLSLTDKEYRILRLLLLNRGKIYSVQSLYENVWEDTYFPSSSNTVMVHIRKLREKIERNPQTPEILKTEWGRGYRIE